MKRQQGGYAALIIVVLFVLALLSSLTMNKVLHGWYEEEKAKATAFEAKLNIANGETKKCNDSIGDLETKAFDRGVAAGKARAEAKARSNALAKRGQGELSTPATVPGDACKSVQDRVRRILSNRGKP